MPPPQSPIPTPPQPPPHPTPLTWSAWHSRSQVLWASTHRLGFSWLGQTPRCRILPGCRLSPAAAAASKGRRSATPRGPRCRPPARRPRLWRPKFPRGGIWPPHAAGLARWRGLGINPIQDGGDEGEGGRAGGTKRRRRRRGPNLCPSARPASAGPPAMLPATSIHRRRSALGAPGTRWQRRPSASGAQSIAGSPPARRAGRVGWKGRTGRL